MEKVYCACCGDLLADIHNEEGLDTSGWLCDTCEADMEYDDSMDGDHDSAMTSAGWGTDEDYDYYGD